MDLKERIEAFAGLGALVRKSLSDTNETDTSELSLLINNIITINPHWLLSFDNDILVYIFISMQPKY